MATFRKAERKKAKLRLGIVGPAGSGKTYSSLLIAAGIGGRIALIDTENGSGDLYAGRKEIPEYDVCPISAPYTVPKYLEAIKEAENAGYSVIIIDSLSHAWAGDGGLLDQQGKIADSGKGNSYTAWRQVTPLHNKLVESILQSPCHIIATMRAKTEYVLETDSKGKQVPKKVGLAPVQRDGMDYEFTVVFDIDLNHNVQVSKDRTATFDGMIFKPGTDTGTTLKAWLETGLDAPVAEKREVPQVQTQHQPTTKDRLTRSFYFLCTDEGQLGMKKEEVAPYIKRALGREDIKGMEDVSEDELKQLITIAKQEVEQRGAA